MKRFICLVLSLIIVCALLGACQQTQPEEQTEPQTEPSVDIVQKSDPAQDDTLNILMIGSSHCYYYVEELWGMLDKAGIQAKVCNVYYSGCPLENHWNWWKSGEAHYEFFVTDENGRAKTESANLEYCLKQENWDVISLQESGHKIRASGVEAHFLNTKNYLNDLWGYIKGQFPQSRYLWHQSWSYQTGLEYNNIHLKSYAEQMAHMLPVKEYALLVCKEYGLERVNTGEAWQLVRKTGYDNLCARLGVNGDKGDASHDGDIGGGQYLNACVWYEIITGQSCLDNGFRPEYKTGPLAEDLIKLLQDSAHQAVLDRNA